MPTFDYAGVTLSYQGIPDDLPPTSTWKWRSKTFPDWLFSHVGSFCGSWRLSDCDCGEVTDGDRDIRIRWVHGSPYVTVMPRGQRIQVYKRMSLWTRLRLACLWLFVEVKPNE